MKAYFKLEKRFLVVKHRHQQASFARGEGLVLVMCGEAPWGLSRQALRRRQPWALSPEFLQIIPQATSDWTMATAHCRAGGGLHSRGSRPPQGLQGTLHLVHVGEFLDTHMDRSVAAFLFLLYIFFYYTNLIATKYRVLHICFKKSDHFRCCQGRGRCYTARGSVTWFSHLGK